MTDSVLGWVVVMAPTLFALCIELISEEQRKKLKWRAGVICFGVFLSGLTFAQQSRERTTSEKEHQKAVQDTATQTATQVTAAVTEQYKQIVASQEKENQNLTAKLEAQGQDVKAIKGLAIPWLQDRNDHTQETKNKRKAMRFDLARLISFSDRCVGSFHTVGPPGSGGINAEMYLTDCRAWSYQARGYIDGSLNESYKQRFLNAPYSRAVLELDPNLNKQTAEEILQTLHQIMGQAAVLKQFLDEIPPD